jgi:hypothetical protein
MTELTGIRLHITVGANDILRAPRWWVESDRKADLGRAGFALADPDGVLARSISQGDAVTILVGYRNQEPASWTGTIAWRKEGVTRDELEVGCVDPARALATTLITECWENETAEAIIRHSVRQTGLPIGRIDAPGVIIPRFIASRIPVRQLVRQAAETCQRSFDIDMSSWELWLGANGVNWGDFDEPGAVPLIETGELLIDHAPAEDAAAQGKVESFLLPDLRHSRQFRLRDIRRGVDQQFRAQRVRHEGDPEQARTFIWY